MKRALLLSLLCLSGCCYVEYPTPSGTARYIRLDLSKKADKVRLQDPRGATIEIDGLQSDSTRAIDALANLAKAAVKP